MSSFSAEWYFPVYEVIPDTALSNTTYNINSRPASISGDYGIIGDDGKIVKVEGNSLSIVNETNNMYFNPATGQSLPITDWTYDYPERTYNLTLDNGDTATVTYGDENLTIVEGDTVYNVYYLTEGSGEAPADCPHEWTRTGSTPAACAVPGSITYTCSLCSQTKTEATPALGHTWQLKQTVTTQYDETGNLVTQGYTIYECSVCHEQYKDSGGAGPPSAPGGDDPGKPSTIGGLIEKLLSGVGGVVGGLIKGVLSLLTKAVEALAGIGELFTQFTESVVTIFGGFTSFLSAVFPFLPEEFFTIFILGTILLVAAAVLKKFLS